MVSHGTACANLLRSVAVRATKFSVELLRIGVTISCRRLSRREERRTVRGCGLSSWLFGSWFARWPPFVVPLFNIAFRFCQFTALFISVVSIPVAIHKVRRNVWRIFMLIIDRVVAKPSRDVTYSVFGPSAADYSFQGVFCFSFSIGLGDWCSIFVLVSSLAMSSLSFSFCTESPWLYRW